MGGNNEALHRGAGERFVGFKVEGGLWFKVWV